PAPARRGRRGRSGAGRLVGDLLAGRCRRAGAAGGRAAPPEPEAPARRRGRRARRGCAQAAPASAQAGECHGAGQRQPRARTALSVKAAPVATAARSFVGLGANLGDAAATLTRAMAELSALPGTRLVARSSVYRSAPVD